MTDVKTVLHLSFNLPADVKVPVETDGAEVEYRGGRTHDVGGQPDVAERPAERPASHHVIGDGERHHGAGDEHVGHRQRHEEVIAGLPQRPVGEDRGDHEQVAGDREDDDQRQQHGERDVGGQSHARAAAAAPSIELVAVLRRVPDGRDAGRGRGRDEAQVRRPIHVDSREVRDERDLPDYRPTWHVLDDVIARLSAQSSAVLRHGGSRAAAATVVLWRRSMNVETAGDR